MTQNSLIIGAGGHGKVVADIMLSQKMSILGFLDDNPSLIGQTIFSLPVLGTVEMWSTLNPSAMIIAIGDNSIRRNMLNRLPSVPTWLTAIHAQAVIADSVTIGSGTVIMAGAILNPDVVVGKHVIINTAATIDHDCTVADYVHIAPGVHIAGNVQIGKGAFLGISSSVSPMCRIGAGAIIGAGAVVVSDIPDGVTAMGVPARWKA